MLRLATLTSILTALACAPALAEKDGVLRIGVMNDMSGVYSDFQGAGSVLAAQLAVEDFAKQSKRKAEVLAGDHLNKPDVGTAIARRWLDVEGVDMIVDLPNSAVALGVADIVRERNKAVVVSGGGTALLTGERCSPNTVHWTYDTWAFGHGAGSSSQRTMPSGMTSKSRRRTRSWRAAAGCWAGSGTRSVPAIFPRSCCGPSRRARR
jgi:branched-chain amino acid transport system substrate-binding protein